MAATCTEDGEAASAVCSRCDYVEAGSSVIPALGHDWHGTGCSRCDEKCRNPCVDVPKDSFYLDPVLWAVEKGITSGIDDTHFAPFTACNRAQIVTFLYRTLA